MFANLLYLIGLIAVSPLVLYRILRHGRYRRGLAEKLLGVSSERSAALYRAAAQATTARPRLLNIESVNDYRCIWMHAVSVGEVNLLPKIVQQIQQQLPEARIVISSSTDTGYDLACKHFGEQRVFFCPLDFSWAVRRTLRTLRPKLIVLSELELWPNLIRLAHESDCPVVVINGRLSERSSNRYQRFASLTRAIFEKLSWVGCQDSTCRDRFIACGVAPERLTVTGSMKFDNTIISRDDADVLKRVHWAGIDPWHRVWVVGSTQPGEDEMALDLYCRIRVDFPDLRLVLVPRHPERFDSVAAEIACRGLVPHRRSSDKSLDSTTWDGQRVILVDTIGELLHWWGVAHIATVGGSFGNRGGQNMLEPAGFGAAISFGPNTNNFADIANRLLETGGAVRVQNSTELEVFVRRCLSDASLVDQLGQAAQDIVRQHRGATTRTLNELLQWLPATPTHSRAAS